MSAAAAVLFIQTRLSVTKIFRINGCRVLKVLSRPVLGRQQLCRSVKILTEFEHRFVIAFTFCRYMVETIDPAEARFAAVQVDTVSSRHGRPLRISLSFNENANDSQ